MFSDMQKNIPNELKVQIDLSFSIADKIASVLKKRGMTNKEFAKLVGKTEAEVSRWLGGTHNFTLKTIARISSALGCEIIKV